jgi:hypothetical protein
VGFTPIQTNSNQLKWVTKWVTLTKDALTILRNTAGTDFVALAVFFISFTDHKTFFVMKKH